MENVIKKAIEGGYRNKETHVGIRLSIMQNYVSFYNSEDCSDMWSVEGLSLSTILLDPLFWQALGKQQEWGWDEVIASNGGFSLEVPSLEWVFHWHSLIDHIAEGKSIDDFFNNLIK